MILEQSANQQYVDVRNRSHTFSLEKISKKSIERLCGHPGEKILLKIMKNL